MIVHPRIFLEEVTLPLEKRRRIKAALLNKEVIIIR